MEKINKRSLRESWQLSAKATTDYLAWATSRRALFFLPEWMAVVETLSARTWYAWHPQRGVGVAIPVFRRGPFGAAYVGFPVLPLDCAEQDYQLDELAGVLRQAGVADLIRLARTVADDVVVRPRCIALPESLIADLASWPGAHGKRLMRDLKYARNAARDHVIGDGRDSGDALHALYRDTVRRHGGKQRYTHEYFKGLATLSKRRPDLLAIRTLEAHDGTVRAFAVGALHHDVGYYLHAGSDMKVRISGAADLLVAELIAWASAAQANRFTLMPSPQAQTGLVRFKHKWSDTAAMNITEERSLSWKGHALSALLRSRLGGAPRGVTASSA
jgi:hypothetical protein